MRVLFATDRSPHARAAMAFLSRMPFPATTQVQVLHVRDGSEPGSVSRIDLVEDSRPLEQTGWRIRPRLSEGQPVSEVILRTAEEFGADLIVVAGLGRGRIKRFLLGSVANRVAEYASCPVLVARTPEPRVDSGPGAPSKLRILLAFDGSESARRALEWLRSLSTGPQVEIKILTVLQLLTIYRMDILETSSPFWAREREAAAEQLTRVSEALEKSGTEISTELLESGDPSGEINRVAREMAADLIVVGDRGRSPISKALLGSVADRVLHYGPCSVLIVRATPTFPT